MRSANLLTMIAVLALALQLWSAWILVPRAQHYGAVDFSAFYYSGQALRQAPSTLYDNSVPCRFVHPAFESLLFAPLSLLSYKPAYWLFFAVNLLVLIWLWVRFGLAWQLLGVSGLSVTLITGQDSILLLALLLCAFKAHTRPLLCGLFLGLCLFRFQNIVPMVTLLLIWREWRVLKAFAMAGTILALISAAIYDPFGYIAVMRDHAVTQRTPVARMTNLRGLLLDFSPAWTPALTLVTGCLILALVAYYGRQRNLEWRISASVLAASLVSYHFFIHDFSIVVIPLAVLLQHGRRALVALMVAVSNLAVINVAFYVIPLTTLFILMLLMTEKTRHADVTCRERYIREEV